MLKYMSSPSNLLADLPDWLPHELTDALLTSKHFRIERIISLGNASPEGFWYDQETHEWVLLMTGAARLRFEGQQPMELVPGSFINIPAHQRHRVDWTDPKQPTVWLAIYYGD
jgi:cupin 2 domain-containing protein